MKCASWIAGGAAGLCMTMVPALAQDVPPVSGPVCVESPYGCPGSDSTTTSGTTDAGGWYRPDPAEIAYQRKQAARRLNNEGNRFLSQGANLAAVARYRLALGNDPTDTMIRSNLAHAQAMVAMERKDFGLARERIMLALAHGRGNEANIHATMARIAEAARKEGLEYLGQGYSAWIKRDIKGAERGFARAAGLDRIAIALNPQDKSARAELAIEEVQLIAIRGNYEGASRQLDAAIAAIDPQAAAGAAAMKSNWAAPIQTEGLHRAIAGDDAGALALFRLAHRFDPESPAPLVNTLWIEARQAQARGDHEAAVDKLIHASAMATVADRAYIHPGGSAYLRNLLAAARAQRAEAGGDTDAAVAHFCSIDESETGLRAWPSALKREYGKMLNTLRSRLRKKLGVRATSCGGGAVRG